MPRQPRSSAPNDGQQPSGALNSWSVAQHDTIPQVDLWLNPLDTHTYLFAFLDADGEGYSPPYDPVRESVRKLLADVASRERKGQAPSADVRDQRIRTWKSVFESFGLLTVDEESRIRLSPLGRVIKSVYGQVNERIEGANDHIAKLAVNVLNRQTLRNPLDEGGYPEDSDLRPFRLIWKAMRRLDDKLHWEEMNRVLMKVLYEREAGEAIEHIKAIRRQAGLDYSTESLQALGTAAVDDGSETKRRITPWFSRAGFGGLLITPIDDEHGFRSLNPKYKHLIDEALQDDTPVPAKAMQSRSEYLHFITQVPSIASSVSPEDSQDAERIITAANRYGGGKIICLSGIPGTGKSYLAKIAAMRIVDGDPYRFAEIQFHENTSYDDFMEGFVPKPSGDGFELRNKVFRTINRRARLDPSQAKYVLLIEEFTRANVHAVLGELLTYIEHRNRPFHLSTSQEEERIAPNLIVLATMNPRDKSALVLDQAILRRLHTIEFNPSVDRLRSMLAGKLESDALERLSAWFHKFVTVLPFGHGAFADVTSELDLRDQWTGTLRRFLTDYSGSVKEIYRDLEQEFPWR